MLKNGIIFGKFYPLHIGHVDFIQRAYLIEGETDNSRLFGQSLQDRLTNPPYSVRDKLEATGFVEFLSGFDETQITFVDQVGQA